MKYCPKCGKQLDDAAAWCSACGAPQTAPEQPTEQPAVQPQETAAPLAVQPQETTERPAAEQPAAEQPAAEPPAAEPTPPQPVGAIDNPLAGQGYTTVPYSAGYEVAQPGTKKKKPSAKVVIPIVCGIIAACVALGLFSYFTGDEYTYKKALDLYHAGQYEEAYKKFFDLGDYKDSKSFLPFHGQYRHCSDGFDYTYTFSDDGTYKYVVEDDEDGDKTYTGTYTTDGYSTAYLTEEDGEKKTFMVHKQYIYRTDHEDTCFDDQIDAATDLFNAVLTEDMTYESLLIKWKYTFEDDGTYKLDSKAYYDGDQFGDYPESGTYEVKDGVITLTSNEDNDKLVWIVDENGYIYRTVFSKAK